MSFGVTKEGSVFAGAPTATLLWLLRTGTSSLKATSPAPACYGSRPNMPKPTSAAASNEWWRRPADGYALLSDNDGEPGWLDKDVFQPNASNWVAMASVPFPSSKVIVEHHSCDTSPGSTTATSVAGTYTKSQWHSGKSWAGGIERNAQTDCKGIGHDSLAKVTWGRSLLPVNTETKYVRIPSRSLN